MTSLTLLILLIFLMPMGYGIVTSLKTDQQIAQTDLEAARGRGILTGRHPPAAVDEDCMPNAGPGKPRRRSMDRRSFLKAIGLGAVAWSASRASRALDAASAAGRAGRDARASVSPS